MAQPTTVGQWSSIRRGAPLALTLTLTGAGAAWTAAPGTAPFTGTAVTCGALSIETSCCGPYRSQPGRD